MNNEPLQQNVTRAKRRALQVVFVTICCLTVLVNFLLAEMRAPDRFHAENTFRTTNLTVDQNSDLGAVGTGSNVGVGVTNFNGPTRQTVDVPGSDYDFGELNLDTITGTVPNFPHDLFVSVIRNQASADTTTHTAHTGGFAIETNAVHSAGSNALTVTGVEIDATVTGSAASSNDVLDALHVFHGDITTDVGNVIVNGPSANIFQTGASGFIATLGTFFAEGNGTNAIDISGAPTNQIKMRAAASQIDVDNNSPSSLNLYNASGTFQLKVTGTEAVSSSIMHNGLTAGQLITGGPGAPAINCNQGDLYTRNDGSTSTTLYACTAANTWTALGASGAGTPSMTIANATQAAAVNLSTTGTGQLDWLFASPNQQGNSTRVYDSFAATLESKLTGGGLLLSPGIDVIGSSGTNANSNGTVTFSSTASDTTTQVAISSASGNGITAAAVNAGFRFVAPVTTSSRVFRIYNSHSNSTWSCTAHLMDGSVSDKTTTPTVATTAVEEIQTITVTAGSDTNLVVYCVITATSGTAVIKWYAEILSLT